MTAIAAHRSVPVKAGKPIATVIKLLKAKWARLNSKLRVKNKKDSLYQIVFFIITLKLFIFNKIIPKLASWGDRGKVILPCQKR